METLPFTSQDESYADRKIVSLSMWGHHTLGIKMIGLDPDEQHSELVIRDPDGTTQVLKYESPSIEVFPINSEFFYVTDGEGLHLYGIQRGEAVLEKYFARLKAYVPMSDGTYLTQKYPKGNSPDIGPGNEHILRYDPAKKQLWFFGGATRIETTKSDYYIAGFEQGSIKLLDKQNRVVLVDPEHWRTVPAVVEIGSVNTEALTELDVDKGRKIASNNYVDFGGGEFASIALGERVVVGDGAESVLIDIRKLKEGDYVPREFYAHHIFKYQDKVGLLNSKGDTIVVIDHIDPTFTRTYRLEDLGTAEHGTISNTISRKENTITVVFKDGSVKTLSFE